MKAQKQQLAPGTGANTKSCCNKLPSLKVGAHINKSPGDMSALSVSCPLP